MIATETSARPRSRAERSCSRARAACSSWSWQALLLGEATLDARIAVGERAPHREAEPTEPVLDQVVGRAAPHALDRLLLAHRPADHDERDVGTARVQQIERLEGAELGQAVVGEDDVRSLVEQAEVPRRILGAAPLGVEAGPAQLGDDQLGVEDAIFEHEQLDGRRVVCLPQSFGGWLSSAQYNPNCRTASVNCSKSTGLTM